MGKCHICGGETEWECRDCGELVCDSCVVPYNQFTQIDYTLCKNCGEIHSTGFADECNEQIAIEKYKLKEKDEENRKRREYYRSPNAVEKRRIKKLEELERKREQNAKWAKRRAEIIGDILKHMR